MIQKIAKKLDNYPKWIYNTIKDIQNGYIPVLIIKSRSKALERRKVMSKLRGYRVMLGLTQQQMANKLKISLQSYNNKELGKTPFNDKERLAIKSMIAEIKPDITIDELFYN